MPPRSEKLFSFNPKKGQMVARGSEGIDGMTRFNCSIAAVLARRLGIPPEKVTMKQL